MSTSRLSEDEMTWDEAVDAMMAGYVIARRAWNSGEVALFADGVGRVGRPGLEPVDIAASDWQILGPVQ